MITITCGQLRQMIADVLSVSIDEIRAAKDNQFFYEFDMPPTDDEVDEFVLSSKCFDDEMKEWLLGKVRAGYCCLRIKWELVPSRGNGTSPEIQVG